MLVGRSADERTARLEELRRLGCEAAQGFLWAPPPTADQVQEWGDLDAHTGSDGPRT